MIQEIPITSREQWLTARHQDVTASQAAALLGIHPYSSAFSLYVEKSGPLQLDDGAVSGPMERGLLLEPVAIKKLQRDHPDWDIIPGTHYYRDPAKRIGATPDALVWMKDRPEFGVIQFKSVEPGVFKRNWRNEAGEIEPPLWIVVQAAVERELTGASYALVVPLVIGFSVEIHEIEIPYEPTLITRIEADVAEFWTRVENKRPPDVTSPKDAEVLATLYHTVGGTVDLSGDNELTTLADEDEDLKAQIRYTEERRKIIKARFMAAMGNAGVGYLSDGRCIIRQQVDVKAYTVPAKSYIKLTLKEPRA